MQRSIALADQTYILVGVTMIEYTNRRWWQSLRSRKHGLLSSHYFKLFTVDCGVWLWINAVLVVRELSNPLFPQPKAVKQREQLSTWRREELLHKCVGRTDLFILSSRTRQNPNRPVTVDKAPRPTQPSMRNYRFRTHLGLGCHLLLKQEQQPESRFRAILNSGLHLMLTKQICS